MSQTPSEPSAPASSAPQQQQQQQPPRRSSDLLSVRAPAPSRRAAPGASAAQEEEEDDDGAYNTVEDPLASSIISNLELPEGSADGHGDGVEGASLIPTYPVPPLASSAPAHQSAAAPNTSVTTPGDVLNIDVGSAPAPAPSGGGAGVNNLAPPSPSPSRGVGDDSALDALLAAHSTSPSTSSSVAPPLVSQHPTSAHRQASSETAAVAAPSISRPSSRGPSSRDASFGLDPDADEAHAISGHRILPHIAASSSAHPDHHHHHHHHQQEHSHHHRTASGGAPLTTAPEPGLPSTVPTASATGMPRVLPRRTSRSSLAPSDSPSTTAGGPPAELQPPSAKTPTGSLTLAALTSSSIPWTRRLSLLLASAAINLGLPFLNGVMLGFGEIFARAVLAPALGIAPAAVNVNAPAAAGGSESRNKRESNVVGRNTAQVGLRGAGNRAPAGYAKGSEGVEVENWTVER